MKAFLVIVLAALTAWVAVTASEMETAHRDAGRPKRERVVADENPAARQLRELVNDYGARQVLFAGVGIVAGLLLAFTVAMKVLKVLAFGCVVVMAFVLWQAWERGWLTGIPLELPSARYSERPE